VEEELDFETAMTAPAPPEVQARQPKVVAEGSFIEEIVMPMGVDVRPTALSLVPYEEKVKALVLAAREIRVEDEEGRKNATELGLVAKKLRLKVETIKKSPTFLAAETFIKDIRHLCKTLTDPLQLQVENVCKEKLTAYTEQLRLEQQRREAAAREEARQLQTKLDAEAATLRAEAEAKAKAAAEELSRPRRETEELTEAEKAILEQTVEDERAAAESIVAPTVVVHVEETDRVMRTEAGASFPTSRWKPRLVDISLVDRKYLVVDLKVVQRDVDGGIRQIPGFVIEEVLGTSLRG